jgi:3-oxoadipate enol-lactonase
MPSTNVNDVRVYWHRAGSGARLLFCNGSGATLVDARPFLDPLEAQFDLLAFDYRGLGRSGPLTGSYEMADLAADVVGLLDVIGWDTCRVIGISFGGMVAQELAVTHPNRVERLALACTSAGGDGGSSYPLHTLDELPAAERAATELRLFDSRWDERWLEAHPGDRLLAERLRARRNQRHAADATGRTAQLHARAGHDVWDRLGAIACPTLIGYGRYDGIAPPENSRAIASKVRRADLRGYEGGHAFLVQDPTAIPAFVAFLQADDAGGVE